MSLVLCIDADWDRATNLVRAFRDSSVYPFAQAFKLRKLQGKMARRQYIQDAARDPAIKYVTASGHGNTDTFTGNGGEKIWSVGSYTDVEVAGRVVHLLSCSTASLLGPDMVDRGALSFIGYDADFIFTERSASIFLECASQIDLILLGGGTVADAHEAAKNAFNSAASIAGAQDAARLEFNRDHLMSAVDDERFGSPDAKI